MKQAFIEKKFRADSLAMIEKINGILEKYRRQGFRLSLRQLYYQLVAGAIIENTTRSYQNIGSLVSDARQAGLIDWDMIEDRGRETVSQPHWASPADIVTAAARQFRIDKWADQDWHIEIMVEKDALSGVLLPVCRELDIAITANKGYSSSSTMYEIGRRLNRLFYEEDKKLCVIYLGDHDPSGIDMTRDVIDRLGMYSELVNMRGDSGIDVVRVALNWNQIELWQPPENPAKTTDSRYQAYADEYGESSWELDAVEPAQLARLIRETVASRRDQELWDQAVERENKMRADLQAFADTYED